MVKLIIVDDHFHVREAWCLVLSQEEGIEIVARCDNGQEAIEAAKNLMPDVILMDIHMEPVNGIEATRMIKQFDPRIRIIALSIQADRSYVNEMLRIGAEGYVTKNSPGTEMMRAIGEVMAGRTYVCEELAHLRTA